MSKNIEIKSKVENLCDFKTIDISEHIPEFTPDEAQIEKDVKRFLSRYGQKVEADTISEGDMVTFSCKSSIEKYNKDNIIVLTGKGLFGAEFEAQLVGKERGEDFECEVDGEKVAVNITKIKHTVMPDYTDGSLKALGVPEVQSVEDLRRQCIDKQIDKFLLDDESADMASAYVWQEVTAASEFALDEEEKENALENAKRRYEEMLEREPEEPEEMPMDLESFWNMMAINELKIAVIGYKMMKEAGKILTEDDYEAYLEKMKPYNADLSDEELRAKFKLENYAREEYADYFAVQLDAYVAECFKKAMNK